MLRSAVYHGDGRAVVALAPRAPGPDDALQLLGDGLAAALAQDVEGAGDLALACAGALRERGFYGDGDLADRLEALAGKRALLPLIALPVDLDDLATVLEGDPIDGGGRIDRQTGEVWHRAAVEYAREIGDEDEESAEDRNAGFGSDVRVRTRAIATWSCSSIPSPIRSELIAWASRSTGAARSVGSRTCSGAGRGRSSAGTRSPRSASGAGPAPGSPGPATAWSRLCDHGQRTETSSDNVIPSRRSARPLESLGSRRDVPR